MKSLIFNEEMRTAAKEGRKTATRRMLNPQPRYAVMTAAGLMTSESPIGVKDGLFVADNGNVTTWDKMKYRPSDILYLPEPWRCVGMATPMEYTVEFQDGERVSFHFGDFERAMRWEKYIHKPPENWQSPYFMPWEAARTVLRTTGVAVERVGDITDEGARAEGCADRADFARVWDACYAGPRPVKGASGEITHYESVQFADASELRSHKGKPWNLRGNPWVYVIGFEPIPLPAGLLALRLSEGG